MTAGADVHGFYAALDVELPETAGESVKVRCFANPDVHPEGARECSVNVRTGEWCCAACGGQGPPFTAALACGRDVRDAMEMLKRHGLADGRRSDPDLARWRNALLENPELLAGLERHGWQRPVVEVLGLGFDGDRIVIPVRSPDGDLLTVLRYKPGREPKPGTVRAMLEMATAATPASQPPAWPAQPDSAAFCGLAGDVVRTIEPHSEADPAALLVQFLVAFGNAVGRGPGFRAEADHHGTNLFALLVGETAKGRKGTSWGHIRRLMEHADSTWAAECVAGGLSSGEGLIWQVRDPITKQVPVKGPDKRPTGEYEEQVEDEGVEDKRLLVLEPEFAQVLKVLGREGNTLSPVVRKAWDDGELRTMTRNSPARASNSHISIIGHITSDELRRRLGETEAANGFANRFLFVCARRSKQLPEGGHLPLSSLSSLANDVREALRVAAVAKDLQRDDEARALWASIYGPLSEGRAGMLGTVTSRSEAQVMRLAVLYALLDASNRVRIEHLRAALALWDYCDRSAQHIFGDALGDLLADELLEALLEAGDDGLTRTQIRDRLKRHQKRRRVDAVLDSLRRLGLAYCEKEDTGGRPVERWWAA